MGSLSKKYNRKYTISAMYLIEHDKRSPELGALLDFADFYGVSLDYLLGRDLAGKTAYDFVEDKYTRSWQLSEQLRNMILGYFFTIFFPSTMYTPAGSRSSEPCIFTPCRLYMPRRAACMSTVAAVMPVALFFVKYPVVGFAIDTSILVGWYATAPLSFVQFVNIS